MADFEHCMDAEDIGAFIHKIFPQADGFGRIESIGEGRLSMELETKPHHLRPGGTVSGPVMMTLADTAAYYLILSLIGPVALAVTTSLHIDFLRRPQPGPVQAKALMLKLGKRLAVVQVEMFTGEDRIANASITYSIPPR